MCGIVGIFRYGSGPGRVDERELLAIRDHMARRGPDGAGSWTSPDGAVAFGHRRLAIIGLGEQGAQPMSVQCVQPADADAPVVTFNGEIYNHVELRRGLEEKGHTFRSRCDTEVLLHLYEEYGDDLVDHLRGMYAFGIWDPMRARLLLARDPFGVKPLYIADDGKVLRFASQARALLAGGKVSAAPDDGGLAGFLVLGSVPEPRTCWSAIKAVPAGSTMVVERTGTVSRTFFSVPHELQEARQREGGRVSEAVRDSVKAHLVADVDVGVFLSSGVDSGVMLALAAEAAGDVTAVTLGFDDFQGTDADEVPVASIVARHYGARHVVDRISAEDFRLSVKELLAAMDQPTVDGVNTWFVSRAAQQANLKVVLSGLGGDEIAAGYETFTSVPRWHRRLRPLALIPGLGPTTRKLLQAMSPRLANPKAASVIEYGATLRSNWLLRRSVFLPWELSPLLGRERATSALESLDLDGTVLCSALTPDPGSSVSRVAAMETSLYMRNQLLRDADWASMDHSLEVRVPLVDPVLYREIASEFSRWSAGNAKAPLKAAPERPLPAAVTRQKKVGFTLPMAEWLRSTTDHGHWRTEKSLAREGTPWSRRWAYTVAAEFGLIGQK